MTPVPDGARVGGGPSAEPSGPLPPRTPPSDAGDAPGGAGRSEGALSGTVWGLLAEGVALPAALASVIVLSRWLGPTDYGAYALAAALVTFIEMNLNAFLAQTTVRFVRTARPGGGDVETTCLRLYVGTGAAVAAALYLSAPGLGSLLDTPGLAEHLRLFCPAVVVMAAAAAHENVLIGRARFRARAALRGAFWVARLVLLMPLLGTGLGIDGAILAYLGAWLVALAVGRLNARPSPFGPGSSALPLVRFAAPLLLSGLALRTFARLDLVALKGFGASLAEVGTYVAAQNLALVPNILLIAFTPVLVSEASAAHASGDVGGVRSASATALRLPMLLGPFAAIGAGASAPLLALAYGDAFVGGAFALRALLLAGLAVALISIVAALLVAVGRPGLTTRIALPMLIAVWPGLAWTVPRYGLDGAAVLMACVASLGALASLIVLWRTVGVAPRPLEASGCALVAVAGFTAATGVRFDGVLLLLALGALALVTLVVLRLCRLVDAADVAALRTLLPGARS